MAAPHPNGVRHRFRPGLGGGDKRLRRKLIYRRTAFVIGAVLCLLVVTPVWKVFHGPLSATEYLLIMIGIAVCGLFWLDRQSYSRCPICGEGVLRPENIGTIRQKLGIVDHPFFRRNVWTQWYRCSHCSYREWSEQKDTD